MNRVLNLRFQITQLFIVVLWPLRLTEWTLFECLCLWYRTKTRPWNASGGWKVLSRTAKTFQNLQTCLRCLWRQFLKPLKTLWSQSVKLPSQKKDHKGVEKHQPQVKPPNKIDWIWINVPVQLCLHCLNVKKKKCWCDFFFHTSCVIMYLKHLITVFSAL